MSYNPKFKPVASINKHDERKARASARRKSQRRVDRNAAKCGGWIGDLTADERVEFAHLNGRGI